MNSSVPTVHSKIGASSMYRWSICPGSVRESEGIKTVSSVFADEGTKAHEIAATVLEGGLYPQDFTHEDIESLNVYINYVNSVYKENECEGAWKLVEHKFDLSKIYPGLFGTADHVMYFPKTKTLYVTDLKWGQGMPVEVSGNQQLHYYGLGALVSTGAIATKVIITVAQPRCFHKDGPIRSEEIDALDLLDFAADLVEAAKRTEDPAAPLVPGDHCHFCPASGKCPALHGKALAEAQKQFSPTVTYNPVKLSEALKAIPMVKAWIKGVESFAYTEATHGRIPPGHKLVDKRPTRKWKLGIEVGHVVEALGTVSPNDCMTDPELKSPAQIEKLAGKSKEVKAAMAALTVSESSGSTLVPIDDDRDEITSGPQSIFKPINE